MVENDVIVAGGVTGAFWMGLCRVVSKYDEKVVLTPVDSVSAPIPDLYMVNLVNSDGDPVLEYACDQYELF